MLKRTILAMLSASLMSMALVGVSALPASASATYTICNYAPYCLNSPGAGNNVEAVAANYASFTAVYPTTWDGHDVAAQRIGAGPDCLTYNGTTNLIYAAVCNGRPSQEFWWDQNTDWMINTYNGWAMCGREASGETVYLSSDATTNGWCQWISLSGNHP
jgi:hypothetical protein